MNRPAPASLRSATPKKNVPCFSGLAGGIFLEKGKDIFLWCSALQVFGQVAGLTRTRFCQNNFSGGKDLTKPRLISDFASGGGGVWGGILRLLHPFFGEILAESYSIHI